MSDPVKRIARMLLFCLAAILLISGPAAGYVIYTTSGGVREHWDTAGQPIGYYINSAGSNDGISPSLIEFAIKSSFQVWDNVSTADFRFQYNGTTAVNQRGQDNVNLVIFDTQASNFKVSLNVGPSVVGITINTYYSETGQIIDSDIFFNDEKYTFTTTEKSDLGRLRINLQDVATHEIGHLLGLDHTFLEEATMYPYTRDGQSSLSTDDLAGISALYPNSLFYSSTDSLSGRVTRGDGSVVWGVYVTAIDKTSGTEAVAGLSDSLGRYTINGLALNTAYYLRAHSVDLTHLGIYVQQGGDPTVYIPQYFENATSRLGAQAVTTSGIDDGFDFQMAEATLLARYDLNFQGTTYVLHFGGNTSSQYYWAVRFPASSLPEAFHVFGVTFYNNDLNMTWPKIMLTAGTDTQPDINNPIRVTTGYVGKEQGMSGVEWEAAPLTNSRTFWVVLQNPDNKSFVALGDGPGLGAIDAGSSSHRDLYFSSNGGASFSPYSSTQFDPKVYLTAALAEVSPTPVVNFETSNVSFGTIKVNSTGRAALPISNSGALELTLSDFESNKPSFFVIAADHTTIQPGGIDTLRLTFTPKSNIAYDGTLKFLTSDPTRPEITIAATGSGAYPAASVSPLTLDFGALEVGESSSRTIMVSNSAVVSLWAWNFASSSSHFTVNRGDTLKIAARDSASLVVSFAPADSGAFSGIFSFNTDDPAQARVEVGLSGSGRIGSVAGCTLPGDGNLDGRVDIFDLLKILAFVSRKTIPTQQQSDCAELNGDGRVDIFDVLAVLKIIAGKSTSLAGTDIETDRSVLRAELVALNLDDDTIAEILGLLSQAGPSAALPGAWSLGRNSPNPFNPSTAISYSVPPQAAGARVSLRVYDLAGRLVKVLADGPRASGEYTVFWDGIDERGRRMPSGVYFYRLTTGDGRVFTRKMVLVK